jgi:phosphoribosylamine--glycine ligase/phosphoribosylformylglycinamidine cyclo-ligase
MAGFAVGVVEREALLPHSDIVPGDVLLGVPSSGLHSNGFSLVRKIIDRAGLRYSSPCPWSPNITVGAALLEPTRIYVRSLLPTIRTGHVKGLSHITGGGFLENIPRVLPSGVGCYVDVSRWQLPPVFQYLMKQGGVQPREMCRTFNSGVGMVLVVSPSHVEEVKRSLLANGEPVVYEIGEVTDGQGVELRGIDTWLT